MLLIQASLKTSATHTWLQLCLGARNGVRHKACSKLTSRAQKRKPQEVAVHAMNGEANSTNRCHYLCRTLTYANQYTRSAHQPVGAHVGLKTILAKWFANQPKKLSWSPSIRRSSKVDIIYAIIHWVILSPAKMCIGGNTSPTALTAQSVVICSLLSPVAP